MVATENIKRGHEITFDYSINEEDPLWKMSCDCGERNCRKTIKAYSFCLKNFSINISHTSKVFPEIVYKNPCEKKTPAF